MSPGTMAALPNLVEQYLYVLGTFLRRPWTFKGLRILETTWFVPACWGSDFEKYRKINDRRPGRWYSVERRYSYRLADNVASQRFWGFRPSNPTTDNVSSFGR